MQTRSLFARGIFAVLVSIFATQLTAHERSKLAFLRARKRAEAKAASLAHAHPLPLETCRLTVRLSDAASGDPLHGLLRITTTSDGKALVLKELIKRDMNWFASDPTVTLDVPQTKLQIEALHGLESNKLVQTLDLTGRETAEADCRFTHFYDAGERGLRSGNTHLHLRSITHAEAVRYLQTVPRADALDLLYVSHLRRLPDERHYITNQFTAADMKRLSLPDLVLDYGQEHRHNFGGYGEGYGHVMFLHLAGLIRPVSIGPGIMGSGTDGMPMLRGIKLAHQQGATVIWCHNTFGHEDVPNWMAGTLDAQNIFDGGNHGSYEDTYYRYLNLGLNVPFSTGTDWFIYDFSRVYVAMDEPLTSERWLTGLRNGRSYITNGTLLELSVNGRPIGSRINLAGPGKITVRGRGIGRLDFSAVELIHNGKVRDRFVSRSVGDHHEAAFEQQIEVDEPGWFALRVALDAGVNEFDKPLFAHTSPVYIDLAGRRIFQADVARALLQEMRNSMKEIEQKAKFADEAEKDSVLRVYRDGIRLLEQRVDGARG